MKQSIQKRPLASIKDMRESMQAQITTLSNGLRIVSEYVPGVESFSLGIWVKAGSRDEKKGHEGAIHCLEHLAFRRTEKRSTKALADAFEQMGAYSNAFTSKEHTCYYVRALSKDFTPVFALMAELTLHPALDEKDIRKEQAIITEEIHSCEDEPEEVIFEIGEQILFGNHAIGKPITGTVESVNALQREDLIALRKELYRPSNMVISLAGNITHEQVVEQASLYFESRKQSSVSLRRRKPQYKSVVHHEEKRKFQQAQVLLGKQTSGFQSQERYGLVVLNMLLGEGMSSRLYQSIRERHGLGYTVYSALDLYSDCGTLFMYTACDSGKLEKARDMMLLETHRLNTTMPVKIKELERAKAQIRSSVLMALESMSARMQALGRGLLEEDIVEPFRETIRKIDAVSLEDVSRLAKAYCETDGWSSVLIHSEHER